ncbi:MAG TPA: glycosyltransferase family 39 protein [Candidatus Omnitrophota bacterium]|nr:glycosyltransferase family 39 protein [Candidatus Omnitrophota bacterium]
MKPFFASAKNPSFLAFVALSISLGLLMPILSQSYAITYDEWANIHKGILNLKYILSGGENTSYTDLWYGYVYSCFSPTLTGALYGLFSGSLRYFVNDWFYQTDHFFAFFQFSHLINSIFGFYLFFFAGLCAKEFRGWRAGCFALLFMAISPRIFAHSMNNSMDIPFAAAYMLSAYLSIRFFKQMPNPCLKTTVLLIVAIGLLIGSRIGGVLFVGYLFLFGFLFYVDRRFRQKESLRWYPWFLRLAIVALYGYLISLFFWPYGQIHPFLNLFRTLARLSDWSFDPGEMLFRGRLYSTVHLPWDYLPVWISISTPLVVLLGWLFCCGVSFLFRKNFPWKFVLFLVFIALFPILTVILKHSPVFNDWRHLYFTYGPLVVLAALGWDYFFELVKNKNVRLGFGFLFLFLVCLPVTWMVRNHPHQALYFNELEGGLKGAAGRFEIDYWGNSLRTAAEWLSDYHLRRYPDQPAIVQADGNILSTYPVLREKLGSRYFPYLYPDRHLQSWQFRYMTIHYSHHARVAPDWDYAIILLQQQTLRDFREGKWPPENSLFEVKVDGVTVCAVTANPKSPLFRKEMSL